MRSFIKLLSTVSAASKCTINNRVGGDKYNSYFWLNRALEVSESTLGENRTVTAELLISFF